jgi:hypothetical protein
VSSHQQARTNRTAFDTALYMNVDRILASDCAEPFPVYTDLVERLLAPTDGTDGDPAIAHVLATIAGYAYSDSATVATIAARLGLARASCVRVEQFVDAMYICSTAYLLQSGCGRVAILAYRGTEPTNITSWLGDADVTPAAMVLDGHDARPAVHGGFYRNFRVTRWQVMRELERARERLSLANPDSRVEHPLEALYVTGHSLGGAMAVLFALAAQPAELRAVYTFAQPMTICAPMPKGIESLDARVFRYVLEGDLVPAMPPVGWGEFVHVGREYRHNGGWQRASEPTAQLTSLRNVPRTLLGLLTSSTRRASIMNALDLHGPHRYIDALRPPDRVTEFGDRV